MHLFELPPEIILRILADCYLQAILNGRLVSRKWKSYIDENESTVYHSAAILHRFIEPEQTLDTAHNTHPGAWLDDVDTWKKLCKPILIHHVQYDIK